MNHLPSGGTDRGEPPRRALENPDSVTGLLLVRRCIVGRDAKWRVWRRVKDSHARARAASRILETPENAAEPLIARHNSSRRGNVRKSFGVSRVDDRNPSSDPIAVAVILRRDGILPHRLEMHLPRRRVGRLD